MKNPFKKETKKVKQPKFEITHTQTITNGEIVDDYYYLATVSNPDDYYFIKKSMIINAQDFIEFADIIQEERNKIK